MMPIPDIISNRLNRNERHRFAIIWKTGYSITTRSDAERESENIALIFNRFYAIAQLRRVTFVNLQSADYHPLQMTIRPEDTNS